MALAQRRAVELRRIANEAEYRAALARIDELASADDLEAAGELDALANYVEAGKTSVRAARASSRSRAG